MKSSEPNKNASPTIPFRHGELLGFMCYEDGIAIRGIKNVELPCLSDCKTSSSMTATINFNLLNAGICFLTEKKVRNFEFMASLGFYDFTQCEFVQHALKVSMRCTFKKINLGKFDPIGVMDTAVQFDVSYLNININGREVVEVFAKRANDGKGVAI